MLHFDLTDLRLFLAIESSKSITKGSQSVHLATSSASARLSELEEKLGVRLFERKARGVSLTSAGSIFYAHAKRLLAEAEHLEYSLKPFLKKSNSNLKIASNYNAMVSFLPNEIGRFMVAHPDLQIDIMQHLSSDIVHKVALGETDLGITAYEGSHPLVSFLPYKTDRLVGIVPEAHPLADKKVISFSDLLDYSYIAIGPLSAMQDYLYDRAKEINRIIAPKIRVTTPSAALSLVAQGAGVSVLPSGSLIGASNIAILPLSESWTLRQLRLCYREDFLKDRPIVQKLIQFLTSETSIQHVKPFQ